MSQRASPTVVGAFVVGALVLVVVGVLLFGSGALLRERIPVVAFFDANVRGLQVGSAVEFRGVRVGSVKRIRLLLDVDTNELLIPVHMELEARSLILAGESRAARSADAVAFLDELVAQGLRARLDLKSFVTGQLAVTLDMQPDTEVVRVGAIEDIYELPTVASPLARVVAVLQDLPLQEIASKLIDTLDNASALLGNEQFEIVLRDTAGAVAKTRQLMSDLQAKIGPAVDEARATMSDTRAAVLDISRRTSATLDEYARLARGASSRLHSLAIKTEHAVTELGGIRASLDAHVAPITDAAVTALDEARGAMSNARNFLAEDSRTRYNLDVALEELAAAARSLRLMADYLEQNPDALLKGKRR
jgi:paraquat-inducible protein B